MPIKSQASLQTSRLDATVSQPHMQLQNVNTKFYLSLQDLSSEVTVHDVLMENKLINIVNESDCEDIVDFKHMKK